MEKKLLKEEGLKKGQSSRSSKVLPGDFFTIFFKKGEKKIVCVIPKKVSKRAVDRNRMRRMILESFRGRNITNQLVVVVKNNFADLKQPVVQEKLDLVVNKLDERNL